MNIRRSDIWQEPNLRTAPTKGAAEAAQLYQRGFEELSAKTGKPAKSIMRMFGAKGNPTAQNLFAVIHQLQRATGVNLGVRAC